MGGGRYRYSSPVCVCVCSIVPLSPIMSRWSKSLRHDPIFNSQLKYKRRVYKMLHLDEKQLKAMHTRTNLRRLLEYVANSQVEKIAKMCSKGLDPNFHCQETGGKEKKENFLLFPIFLKKRKDRSHSHKKFLSQLRFTDRSTPPLRYLPFEWIEYSDDGIQRLIARWIVRRDSSHLGHDVEETLEGDNSAGERWRVAGLSNEGGFDGDASRRGAEQFGSCEDAARARRKPQLQGHEGFDAALLQRHLQNRSDAVRNVAPRPRDDRRPGFAGMAGSASGLAFHLFTLLSPPSLSLPLPSFFFR